MSIVPAWDKPESGVIKNGDIFIYPGMGFGTGSHETTFLCLKSAQKHKSFFKPNMRCKQNIDLNELKESDFKLLLPKDRDVLAQKYEIVFANILQNVLTAEASYLANSIYSKGILILSGLLKGQEDEIISLYLSLNPKLKHVETLVKNDWVAVEFTSK